MSQKATSTVKINKCNKTANINFITFSLKQVVTTTRGLHHTTKTAEIKRCYYLGARWHYGDVLPK